MSQTSGRKQSKPGRTIAGLVIVALVAGLIYWFTRPHHSYESTHGSYRGIGANVAVMGDKVPQDIKATTLKDPSQPIPNVVSLGPVVDVKPGGSLPAPMQMRFKLDHQVAAGNVVYVAARGKASDHWQYQQASLSADGQFATITRRHLTDLWPFSFSPAEIFNKVKDEIVGAFLDEAASQASPPKCGHEADARKEGYRIESNGNAALYWCFGIEKVRKADKSGTETRRVLRVTNRLRYPLNVTHWGLTVVSDGAYQIEFRNLARLGSGNRTILFPFDTAVYSLELGNDEGAKLVTDYSGWAQNLYRFDVSFEMLVTIFAKFGGKVLSKGSHAYWNALDELLDDADCYNAVVNGDVGDMLLKCFNPKRLKKYFDWRAVLLSPFMTGGMLFNWLHGEFNSLGDQLNGRAKYAVLVTRHIATPFDAYAGTWQVHGTPEFVINSDGTGKATWSIGPCLDDIDHPNGPLCNGHAELKFTSNADGSLTGTYGRVTYTTSDNKHQPPAGFVPPSGEVPQEGRTFTVRRNDAHSLITADGTGTRPGNPYLCDRLSYSACSG